MEPYLEYIMASMQGADVQPHLEALSKLPLEKRYVWRVASAMKWGFADFDSEPVAADRETLNPEDFAKVVDLLKFRPIQFCMFLKALVGAEEMKTMMVKAISLARSGGLSEQPRSWRSQIVEVILIQSLQRVRSRG